MANHGVVNTGSGRVTINGSAVGKGAVSNGKESDVREVVNTGSGDVVVDGKSTKS